MDADALKPKFSFSAKNENPKYPVRFGLPSPEWEAPDQKPLSAKVETSQKRFNKRLDDNWFVEAHFKHKGEMVLDPHKEFKIVIQPMGR